MVLFSRSLPVEIGHLYSLEVYYSKYGEERREELLKIAKEFDLYPSAAGDRHAMKDQFEQGDESLLEAMKEACKARKSTK